MLRLVYVQFPETATGVRVAATVQAELRDRGVDAVIKAVSNAQLFLPRTGVLATGNFDMAYVPWTMGADPDDSDVLRCGAPSNYMHWCNARVEALESSALAQTDRRRAQKHLSEHRANCRRATSRYSISSTPINVCVPAAIAALRAQRVPADVERVGLETTK